jgi:SAM-dependent methyltransferase
MDHRTAVNNHYGREGLLNGILAALESTGRNLGKLTTEDLTPLEEFHIGGRRSTLDLAERVGISESCNVLDIGCGIGGPARALAQNYGCNVLGVDLTEEFCDVGRILTELTGLNDRVTIRHASALEIPADDNSFDVVWMQHVSMNIEHKRELAAEIARVTRLGGKLALYEIVGGAAEIAHFPVPWASSPKLNFLVSAHELEALFVSHGFWAKEWTDETDAATKWFRGAVRALSGGNPPQLSLANLMGDRFPTMAKNLLQNLEEGRAAVVRGVLVLAV